MFASPPRCLHPAELARMSHLRLTGLVCRLLRKLAAQVVFCLHRGDLHPPKHGGEVVIILLYVINAFVWFMYSLSYIPPIFNMLQSVS